MVIKDTNDTQDYDPMLWGPAGWKFLHFITFAYPTRPSRQHRRDYSTFLSSVGNVLPCRSCRQHYQRRIRLAKKDALGHFEFLSSRVAFSTWMVDLHNAVNASKGKGSVDYDSIRTQYETAANLCSSPSNTGSYTSLLQDRDETATRTSPRLLEPAMTKKEIAISIAVIAVCAVACAVAVHYHCTSCAV